MCISRCAAAAARARRASRLKWAYASTRRKPSARSCARRCSGLLPGPFQDVDNPMGSVTSMTVARQLRLVAHGLDQFGLAHFAATRDLELAGAVVHLVARALLKGSIGVPGALGARVGRPPLDAASFVHGAGGDLFCLRLAHAALERTFLDV